MKCIKCGRDLPENANFCHFCGAKQDGIEAIASRIQRDVDADLNQADQREFIEQQNINAASSNNRQSGNKTIEDSVADMIYKVVACIVSLMIAVSIIRHIPRLFDYLDMAFRSLRYFEIGWMLSALIGVLVNIVLMAFKALCIITFLVFAFRRKSTDTAELLGATVLTGLALIVVSILAAIFGYGSGVLFTPLLGSAVLFIVALLNGNGTLLNFNYGDFKSVIADIINALTDALKLTPEEKIEVEARRAKEQAAQQQEVYQQPIQSETYVEGQLVRDDHLEPITTNRGLFKYIVFSILTCGIYGFFFIYSLAKDINTMCEGDDQKTGGLLAFIILSYVTCGLYTLYWRYKIANRLQENGVRYGINFTENGTSVLLWDIVGMLLCGIGPFIAMNIIITNTNRLAKAYNRVHFAEQ